MDPIRKYCIIKNSFIKGVKGVNDISRLSSNLPKYSNNNIGSPRTKRNSLFKKEEKINKDDIILPIEIADSFIEMNSVFKLRSSLVLANIDTIFNFSKQENGYL